MLKIETDNNTIRKLYKAQFILKAARCGEARCVAARQIVFLAIHTRCVMMRYLKMASQEQDVLLALALQNKILALTL